MALLAGGPPAMLTRIWIYNSDRDPPAEPRYRSIRPPVHSMGNLQGY